MQKTYIIILVLAFLSGLSTFIGALLAYFFKKNSNIITAGLSFAAGIMILISFLELIPRSLESANLFYALIGVLIGISLMTILNKIIPHTHLCKKEGINKSLIKTAYLCTLGLIIHDFPEGFALANSYIHSPKLGLLIAIAIVLHNIPEEFAMAIPVIKSNKGRKFLFKMSFISSLAEPAGAIFGLLVVSILPAFNSFFIAFAAGAMIFISFHELIPLAIKEKNPSYFLGGLIFSILVYFGLTILLPH
ncbi:ZIP family metal transporter [Patescibacteria group bacterium]